MVRTLQAEEGVAAYFEGLVKQRTPTVQVGVLVGKWSVGAKDVLLAIAPTPPQEGIRAAELTQTSSAAASKPSKASSSKKPSGPAYQVQLDQDWIAEHANQVNRMLPGGLSILGVYLFCPDSAFAAAATQLCGITATICSDAAALLSGAPAASSSSGQEEAGATSMLLLHADSATARLNAKVVPAAAASAAAAAADLKPCEVKTGRIGSNLVKLTCRHGVSLTAAAAAAASANSSGSSSVPEDMQHLLQRAVDVEVARVAAAVADVNGSLYYISSPAAGALDSSSSSSSSSSPAVADFITGDTGSMQLYAAPACCTPCSSSSFASTSSSSSKGGSYSLHGTIQGVAFVYKRDPLVKAITEVKADICKSLRVRAELLADEAAAAAEDAAADIAAASEAEGVAGTPKVAAAAAHPLLRPVTTGKAVAVGLPRRVLLPWVAGVQVCDYLSHVPGAEAAAERVEACGHAAELLSLVDLQPTQVVELEGPASRQATSGASVAKGTAVSGAAGSKGGSTSGGACSGAVVAGAAAAAAVAVLAVGLTMLNMG